MTKTSARGADSRSDKQWKDMHKSPCPQDVQDETKCLIGHFPCGLADKIDIKETIELIQNTAKAEGRKQVLEEVRKKIEKLEIETAKSEGMDIDDVLIDGQKLKAELSKLEVKDD